GPRDGGVALPEHAVAHLLEVTGGPALGIRDDDRLVDEDRHAERMEVPRADVQVAVDVLLDDRRGVVIASEDLAGVRDPPVRLPDADDVPFPLEVALDRRAPTAALGRRQGPHGGREGGLRRLW